MRLDVRDTKELSDDAISFTPEQTLLYLEASGMINLDGVTKDMERIRRENILAELHPYSITASADGKFRTYIKDSERPSGRRQIVRVKREELEDFLIKHYEKILDPYAGISMASLLDEWLDYKSHIVESPTIERDRVTWNCYFADAAIANIPIRNITKIELSKWVHSTIREHNMNRHQFNNFRTVLNQELDYAVDKGIVEKNPFKEVSINTRKLLKREHKKPDHTQVYTKNEVRALCDVAWEDFRKKKHPVHQLTPLAVMFMFYTGLRVGEVCTVRYDDIEGSVLNVRRMFRHSNGEVVDSLKGTFGDREVRLVPEALNLIETARKRQCEEGVSDSGYIFSMNEKPILYSSVLKAFYKYCDTMGIPKRSSHKARKTFVSVLLDNGVNLNTVRQTVGHMDEHTTLNNYHYDTNEDDAITAQFENALTY